MTTSDKRLGSIGGAAILCGLTVAGCESPQPRPEVSTTPPITIATDINLRVVVPGRFNQPGTEQQEIWDRVFSGNWNNP